jgi:hypothetical protein
MELILGLSLGLVLFLCTIIAYTTGLKHGKMLGNAVVPKIEINPVKAVKQHIEAKEEKKQQDLAAEGWANILSYDGTPQVEKR